MGDGLDWRKTNIVIFLSLLSESFNIMLNRFISQAGKSLITAPRFAYINPPKHSETHHHPGLTAKRIIKCVHERLNKVDPERWNGVPISFNTHWRDEGGFVDIETCIHVHEAIEKEFGIDVKDRNILIADVEMAYYVVTQHHDSL